MAAAAELGSHSYGSHCIASRTETAEEIHPSGVCHPGYVPVARTWMRAWCKSCWVRNALPGIEQNLHRNRGRGIRVKVAPAERSASWRSSGIALGSNAWPVHGRIEVIVWYSRIYRSWSCLIA